jgi:hypothetical protein
MLWRGEPIGGEWRTRASDRPPRARRRPVYRGLIRETYLFDTLEGRVSSDHAFLELLLTFDENGEFAGVEVLEDAGGHPTFQGGLFCDVAVAALGTP